MMNNPIIGNFYSFTYSGHQFYTDEHELRIVPPLTVLYRVDSIDEKKGVVEITFENGSPNKFSLGSPMHLDSHASEQSFGLDSSNSRSP